MSLVVDASVAVKIVTREAGSEEAEIILKEGVDLIAPDWMLVEVASALWKKVKYSRLLERHAEDALQDLPLFFSALHPSVPLMREAMALAFRLRHPVYDCLYLALALREAGQLITADQAFHKAVEASDKRGTTRLLTWVGDAA